MKDILKIKNLETSFFTRKGEVQAVRGINFNVEKGEVLGIVGESGSGKSVTSMSIMNLIKKPGKIKKGDIIFDGENINNYSKKKLRNIRGNEISMIFQDPMTSLNPVYTVGEQMVDILIKNKGLNKKQAIIEVIESLEAVGIPSPETRIDNYPHEFSGGMRQRAMIAMALSCKPKLLIADEPTTALDVTIQAQILELMKELKDKTNTSIIIITHDLGVVAETCDRIIVMYGGLIMEEGTTEEIFYNTNHPYTKGLLNSIPKLGDENKLLPIEGFPPNLLEPPKGCPFYDRCDYKMDICKEEIPKSYKLSDTHKSMCFLNRKVEV
ncbi:MAG: ABC transporter ATP-binding protein [Senegalia sp. (in: firmicutes)]|uniref:ABC transporter ATP-binding protein n=1 Tax=Senegalia sp. (in: firmicutes) TaxID=1924098 RepID=UPI003F9B3EF6